MAANPAVPSERAPLLDHAAAQATEDVRPPPSTQSDLNEDDEAIERAIAGKGTEFRTGDTLTAFLVLGPLIVLTVFTWLLIFSSNPKQLKYFAGHPPAQTLAVLLFAYGILTLQPTRRPASKRDGLTRHQLVQGLGLVSILVGSVFMIVNKIDHGAPHFTSWHGKFGLVALIWLVLQALAGHATILFKGKLVGGEENGKALWKWHRLSGYLLFPFLLVTIHLAGGHADWVVQHTSKADRVWIYTLSPLVAFFGLWLRARLDKVAIVQKAVPPVNTRLSATTGAQGV